MTKTNRYETVRGHVVELDPTDEQVAHFRKACGVARFAYNWGLSVWNRMWREYRNGAVGPDGERAPRPNEAAIRIMLNEMKKDKYPWMYEVTKCAPQQAIRNLGRAFERWWKKLGKRPRFHSKRRHNSFYIENSHLRLDNDVPAVRIPNLPSPIRLKERLRLKGRILSATVSLQGGRWFMSFAVAVERTILPRRARTGFVSGGENQTSGNESVATGTVGVDLGISHLATLSTGEKFEGPRALKRYLKKLKRLSRAFSRKKKKSKGRENARRELVELHFRIACIRKDALHKLTTELANRYHTVYMEDLNVAGMSKNGKLARHILDMGFFEFKRQLGYKLEERGGRLLLVDRWYPSSKTCSACGHKLDELSLSVREWTCPVCGAVHDRDANAAANLLNAPVAKCRLYNAEKEEKIQAPAA